MSMDFHARLLTDIIPQIRLIEILKILILTNTRGRPPRLMGSGVRRNDEIRKPAPSPPSENGFVVPLSGE